MQDLIDRLQQLEEAQAFAERTADQLSAEIIRAFDQLIALQRRVEQLEGRLAGTEQKAGGASEADAEGDGPPSAEGP